MLVSVRNFFVGFSVALLAGCGQPASFSEILEQGVSDGLPGIVMHVRMGDKSWTGASGIADLATGRAITADDRFLAPGATEPWVAVATLQLVSEGVLTLEDNITGIIGLEALYRVPNAQRINVGQALAQTSGFHNHYILLGFLNDLVGPGADPNRIRPPTAPLDLFHMRGYRPIAAPGKQASYSAANATVLGMVIEAAGNATLHDALVERVFAPIGVSSGIAGFGGPSSTVHNYIDLETALVDVGTAAIPVDGEKYLYDVAGIHPSWAWAAGGAAVTVAELAKLMDALASGRLLGPDYTALMLDAGAAQANPDDPNAPAYGLGLMHRDTELGIAVGSEGEAMGYGALIYTIPSQDVTVSILANASGRDVTLPQLFARVTDLIAAHGAKLF